MRFQGSRRLYVQPGSAHFDARAQYGHAGAGGAGAALRGSADLHSRAQEEAQRPGARASEHQTHTSAQRCWLSTIASLTCAPTQFFVVDDLRYQLGTSGPGDVGPGCPITEGAGCTKMHTPNIDSLAAECEPEPPLLLLLLLPRIMPGPAVLTASWQRSPRAFQCCSRCDRAAHDSLTHSMVHPPYPHAALLLQKNYVQQAICAVSRTSVLTGRRPDTTQVWDLYTYWRELGNNYTTIPEYFKGKGYESVG